MALRRNAAILEALRSAAAEEEVEEEEEEGSGRTGPVWDGLSTGGAGWRRRAAAVEALVRGPILEKSLGMVHGLKLYIMHPNVSL